VIISYPYVSGSSIPTECSDFANIITQLNFMHERSFVHGDIRLSNMIFSLHGKSTLIDFDFTGIQGQNKYPEGFVEVLADTVRHPEAKGGQLLRTEHDLFSMAAVMQLFKCSNSDWDRVCDDVGCGRLVEAASSLSRLSEPIKMRARAQLDFFGSGSPPYPKQSSKKRPREYST
jgi:serine/threonine protein kinase